MGFRCLKGATLLVLMVGLHGGNSSPCSLQKPSWDCSRDPNFTVSYQEVVPNCEGIYEKRLFSNQPEVKFDGADETKTYTIVMADPDAPGHREGYAYLHWIISRVSGRDLLTGELTTGTTVSKYVGPTPPEGTGIHRYVTFVYEELPSSGAPSASPNKRGQFNLHSYAQTSDLCGPLAQSTFRTAFDERESEADS